MPFFCCKNINVSDNFGLKCVGIPLNECQKVWDGNFHIKGVFDKCTSTSKSYLTALTCAWIQLYWGHLSWKHSHVIGWLVFPGKMRAAN